MERGGDEYYIHTCTHCFQKYNSHSFFFPAKELAVCACAQLNFTVRLDSLEFVYGCNARCVAS
jgi:hypothetical protein